MLKKTCYFEGEVISMGEIISIQKGNKEFKRRLLGVISEDNQVIYFEARKTLNGLPDIGKKVKVEYYFAGSCKGDKVYNNIVILNIELNE